MGIEQIENPAGAFQPLGAVNQGPPGHPGVTYETVYNSGAAAIPQHAWVQADLTGTAGHVFGCIAGVHGGTAAAVVGIALDAIPVAGYGRVCTAGPTLALAGAAGVTAGQSVVPSTVSTDDGELVAGTTVSTVVGIAQQTQATHGGTFAIWVKLT